MNTLRALQISLAVGLIGVIIYLYSSSFGYSANIIRYRQLCTGAGQQHDQLVKPQLQSCELLNTVVLAAIFGPDIGVGVALVGFYIALMAEVNLIFEKRKKESNK
ncbi:MAG: hypothetical protein WAM14_03425 [Candidatus Nitrosopolaris sp.]